MRRGELSEARRAAAPYAAALFYEARNNAGLRPCEIERAIGIAANQVNAWENEDNATMNVALRDVIAIGREHPEFLCAVAALLEREAAREIERRKLHPRRRLTDDQERELFALRRAGMPYRQLALKFGVPIGTVQSAFHRRGKAA